MGLSPSAYSENAPGFGGGEADGHGVTIGTGARGPFDVSVLCTAYKDLNALLNLSSHEVDARLVDPLLWNVNVSPHV